MITKEKKTELIEKYATHKNDRGSTIVQCAILTERIHELTAHIKIHKKDFASGRGLLQLVGQRRRLLAYIKHSRHEEYLRIIRLLELRK